MRQLRNYVDVGVVGGSDLGKQREQLGDDVTDVYKYSFSENGLVGFKDGKLFHEESMVEHIGEEGYKKLVNFIFKQLAEVDCPVKRGTFIEFRKGMINVSPIGRQCTREERNAFEAFDKEAKVREKLVKLLEKEFAESLSLKFSIGGQISFDVFPIGWDKTYCLQFLENEGYDEIHFFGDKTHEGGNDFEIFNDPRTIGHTVKNWEDTMRICSELFINAANA